MCVQHKGTVRIDQTICRQIGGGNRELVSESFLQSLSPTFSHTPPSIARLSKAVLLHQLFFFCSDPKLLEIPRCAQSLVPILSIDWCRLSGFVDDCICPPSLCIVTLSKRVDKNFTHLGAAIRASDAGQKEASMMTDQKIGGEEQVFPEQFVQEQSIKYATDDALSQLIPASLDKTMRGSLSSTYALFTPCLSPHHFPVCFHLTLSIPHVRNSFDVHSYPSRGEACSYASWPTVYASSQLRTWAM